LVVIIEDLSSDQIIAGFKRSSRRILPGTFDLVDEEEDSQPNYRHKVGVDVQLQLRLLLLLLHSCSWIIF
jgi:hypothetical protein